MRKYRFYRDDNGARRYLGLYGDDYTDRAHAGLFTEIDWTDWGCDTPDLQIEELNEDELMRLAGAPMLPGLDL